MSITEIDIRLKAVEMSIIPTTKFIPPPVIFP